MLKYNAFIFNKLSNEVTADVNMLSSRVLYRILGNINGTYVITKESECTLVESVVY